MDLHDVQALVSALIESGSATRTSETETEVATQQVAIAAELKCMVDQTLHDSVRAGQSTPGVVAADR